MDKETQKVLSEGEELALFVKGRQWEIIKNMIKDRIVMLNDISTIPDDKDIGREIYARKKCTEQLLGVINEIKGTVNQHKNHRETLKKIMKDDIVLRIED